jgi:hypothetical protein
MHCNDSDADGTLANRGRKPTKTRLWTVPRVEVPTRLGLVVIGLRRGCAVIFDGPGRLAPILLPAQEALPPVEPAFEETIVTPKDGRDYLLAIRMTNPGARYVSSPSEILERRPYFRRRGRLSATLLSTGEITVHGDESSAGLRWLSGYAVPSLRREDDAIRRGERPTGESMPRRTR